MDILNQKVSGYVSSSFKELISDILKARNYLKDVYMNNNSLIMLGAIICLITMYKILKRKGFKVNKNNIVELFMQIVIAISIGFLIRISGVQKVIIFLSMYWKLAITIFLFMAIILTKDMIIYKKSIKKILLNFFETNYLLGLTCLFATIASSPLSITNYIVFIIILIFIRKIQLFTSFVIEKDNEEQLNEELIKSEEADIAVKTFDKLLPTRKNEFLRIYDYMININYDEPFAIAINAKWGEGKTSLVTALIDRFEKENNYVINFQPMVLDTNEKLMTYFFSQLEILLNSNGVFTGRESPFKRYFNLIMKFVNDKTLINFSEFFNIDSNVKVDFRETKKIFETDIQKLFSKKKNQKLYIIIDDFDRIEEETMYNTLVFIKEIVNFKGINVLFLIDYSNLKGDKITIDYLDKFVNKRFDLCKIDQNEIFNYFIKNLNHSYSTEIIKSEVNSLKQNIIHYINDLHKNISKSIEDQEKALNEEQSKRDREKEANKELENTVNEMGKKIIILNQQLEKFEFNVKNIRRAKKIIREIKEVFIYLDKKYININQKILQENLNAINMHELVLKISILKVAFDEYYDNILIDGEIEAFYNANQDPFLMIYLNEFTGLFVNEEKLLIRNLKKDFYNSVIFTEEISGSIYCERKTNTERLLSEIDDVEQLIIKDNFFENIKAYIDVVKYNSWNCSPDLIKKRLGKIIELIFRLLNREVIAFHEVIYLIEDYQHNPILMDKRYPNRIIEHLKNSNVEFLNKKQKNKSQYIIDHVEVPVYLEFQGDIISLLRLLTIKDRESDYESIRAGLHPLKLKEVNSLLIKTFQLEDKGNDQSPIIFFEEWSSKAIMSIKSDNPNNYYLLKVVETCEIRISAFIELFKEWQEVKQRVNNLQVSTKAKFLEKLSLHSTEELIKDITELHQYIVIEENEINNDVIIFFQSLINMYERVIRETNLYNSEFEKLKAIYQLLSDFENKEERTWFYCTLKMGEIEENVNRNSELILRLIRTLKLINKDN